jgi:TPR repeat protein
MPSVGCTKRVLVCVKTKAEAVNWYRKVATQGHPFAQKSLRHLTCLGKESSMSCLTRCYWHRPLSQFLIPENL